MVRFQQRTGKSALSHRLRGSTVRTMWLRMVGLTALCLVALHGCGPGPSGRNEPSISAGSTSPRPATGPVLEIISGSENEALEPILQEFAKSQGFGIKVTYRGSVDIMLELDRGRDMQYDAIWPANSLWIELGDRQKVVKLEESVMHSPVVFGVKRSVAERLGWLEKEVTIADVLKAAEAKTFRFSMTSATQSNSGACAYLGFLHALAGSPDVLSAENLADPAVQDATRRLLQQIDRSSGSSGWLKQTVVKNYAECEAMVNYESMIIEANQELVSLGQEPLVAIYPADGLTIADSPLGYVDHGDPVKQDLFEKLMAHLKSEPVQARIVALGRRAGLVGLDASKVDAAVFNAEWGISIDRVISPIPLPGESVLREALSLYQSGGLRKPSATVYAIDCSGSMQGAGISQLKSALHLLLDPEQSRRFLLDPSQRDVHIVVPFDSQPRETWVYRGNDPAMLAELRDKVDRLVAEEGTNMYAAIQEGIQRLDKEVGDLSDYFPAVIVMTDGKSAGNSRALSDMIQHRKGTRIPIFSITFGAADDKQLKDLSEHFQGRVFDGQKDLTKAFRDARGYN